MSEFLFYNGLIYGYQPEQANAVFIKDHLIHAVGKTEDLLPMLKDRKNRYDLMGKVLLPAFTDTHTHFYSHSRMQQSMILSSAKSIEDLIVLFENHKKKLTPETQWVRGWGWDLNRYENSHLLDVHFLDQYFPDIPISLESYDLHTRWCNSLALQKAGITRESPNPPGGRIGKDQDGELNGFLYEKAWHLIIRAIPPYTKEQRKKMIRKSIEEAWIYGLCGVHTMEDDITHQIFHEISQENQDFRFTCHFPYDTLDEKIEERYITNSGDLFYRNGGMKLFMDGALGSHTAWMDQPYPNEPDNYGSKILEPEELRLLIVKAGKKGIYSAIHAIGNRCVHEVIQAIIFANNEIGQRLPHRIEHLQCIKEEDLSFLKQSGAFCAMQPVHMKEDIDVLDRVWGSQAKDAFKIKTLINEGIPIAFGSDAPVETINPFAGIYSAIHRQAHNLPDQPVWHPEECIEMEQAIDCYTKNAALFNGLSSITGQISTGFLADLIVLDNKFNDESTFWLTAKSLFTMIHGKCVYCK